MIPKPLTIVYYNFQKADDRMARDDADNEFMYELDEDTSRADMRSRASADSLDDDQQLLEKGPALKVPVGVRLALTTADEP